MSFLAPFGSLFVGYKNRFKFSCFNPSPKYCHWAALSKYGWLSKDVLETTYQIIQNLIVIYPSYPSKSILVGALPPAAANPTCSGLNWKTTSVTCASCKASMWICRLGSRQKYSPAKYQEKNLGEVLDLANRLIPVPDMWFTHLFEFLLCRFQRFMRS